MPFTLRFPHGPGEISDCFAKRFTNFFHCAPRETMSELLLAVSPPVSLPIRVLVGRVERIRAKRFYSSISAITLSGNVKVRSVFLSNEPHIRSISSLRLSLGSS